MNVDAIINMIIEMGENEVKALELPPSDLSDVVDTICCDIKYGVYVELKSRGIKNVMPKNVRLAEENTQLKLRNKMLTKIVLNSIYGIHCCKNHCVYIDTDSIKSEGDDRR